jgi:hypothetical protein
MRKVFGPWGDEITIGQMNFMFGYLTVAVSVEIV